MKEKFKTIFGWALLTIMMLSACTSPAAVAPTPIPLPKISTSVPIPTLAATAVDYKETGIWFSPDIPKEISKQLLDISKLQPAPDRTASVCTVEPGNQNQTGAWVYALVAPFNTVVDNVDENVFLEKWKNHAAVFPARIFLLDQESENFISSVLGNPDPLSIQVTQDQPLLDTSWKNPDSWAIIPFDSIQPEWKVISISDIAPIHKQFDSNSYSLSIPFSVTCKNQADMTRISASPITNRDANSLTTIILTGVTALVRGTAYAMETKGITYPAKDIRDILREADFTHISNEVPYWPKCPRPFSNPGESKLVFCSDPKYNQLLEDVGADIIELSGDHFNDWGPEATTYTIDLYKKLGWSYYGGGDNLEDGRKPLLIEHNGNKIAFLGCNAKPPGYGTASATRPGAVHCNFEDMDARIKAVKAQGYIPIVTFQHLEYYSYGINPFLQVDFRNVADAGAAIVSGSQAHQPQGIEFYKGAFLHYGLGNLFFDQYKEGFPTRQAFIDRYVFYKGKYVSTELITIMFTDLAHSRLMDPAERQDLLQTIFKVSIWPFNN
jgi:hypothetical protein